MSPFFNDFYAPHSTLHPRVVQLSSSAASADQIGITPCGVSTTLRYYLLSTSTDPSALKGTALRLSHESQIFTFPLNPPLKKGDLVEEQTLFDRWLQSVVRVN